MHHHIISLAASVCPRNRPRQESREHKKRTGPPPPPIGWTLRILVIIARMVILHVTAGLDVGLMLASLGIGGIAVVLATEDSIANVQGSFTILFDKSFYRGAVISVENEFCKQLITPHGTGREGGRNHQEDPRKPCGHAIRPPSVRVSRRMQRQRIQHLGHSLVPSF